MKRFNFVFLLIISLFAFPVIAFSMEDPAFLAKGPSNQELFFKTLSAPEVIAIVTLKDQGGSPKIHMQNIGLISESDFSEKKLTADRTKYLDTAIRFEHLTKYSYFSSRGRRHWKYCNRS